MRVAVVGSGPAGLRHLANLGALGHEGVLVSRSGAVATLDDAAAGGRLDAVVVATPPSEHLAALGWAVERRLPVLVEKPLGATADGFAEVLARAESHVAVAYNLRFHPALRAIADAVASGRIGRLLHARVEVGSHLPGWNPDRDFRRSAAARRELGGGALLTLAHELDIALWIGGPARLAAGVRAKVSSLETDADDVAELVLRHDGGALSSVHMDLVDRLYNRRSRWVGERATIEWRWGGPVVVEGETLWEDGAYDPAETFVRELESFLRGERPPGDALRDALLALELVDAVPQP